MANLEGASCAIGKEIEEQGAAMLGNRADNQLGTSDIIRKKCVEEGISSEAYMRAWEKYQEDVKLRYSAHYYTKEWIVWKAQSLLWDHFCKCSGPARLFIHF
jgi:hypothetical protein